MPLSLPRERGHWLAATLAGSLTREWDGVVESFDAPPGGPVVVSLVLRPRADGRSTERAWARFRGPRLGPGWAVHGDQTPGDRFALCL